MKRSDFYEAIENDLERLNHRERLLAWRWFSKHEYSYSAIIDYFRVEYSGHIPESNNMM